MRDLMFIIAPLVALLPIYIVLYWPTGEAGRFAEPAWPSWVWMGFWGVLGITMVIILIIVGVAQMFSRRGGRRG